jgi:hypothetical protein
MSMQWEPRQRLAELKDTIRPVDGFATDYWTLQSRILASVYHEQIYRPTKQPLSPVGVPCVR